MKVERNGKRLAVRDVSVGGCFWYSASLCMRILRPDDATHFRATYVWAVNLESGEMLFFSDKCIVNDATAKVVTE